MIEVSVILPVYNGATTLERAVASVARQSPALELLIVDDDSDDGSGTLGRELLQRYRIDGRVLPGSGRRGAASARNVGIEAASGRWIAFLDSDDLWLPGKLSKQLATVQPCTDVVSCDSLKVAPDGTVHGRSHLKLPPVSGPDAWKALLGHNFMPTPTVLARARSVHASGGFDVGLAVAEDLDLWIRLAKRGEVAVVPEVLVHYFDYDGSLMKRQGMEGSDRILEMIRSHLEDERLSADERRAVLAERFYELGRHSVGRAEPSRTVAYFDQAIRFGYDPREIAILRCKVAAKRALGLL